MLRLLCSEPNTEVHRMTKRDNGRKAGGANVKHKARTRTRQALPDAENMAAGASSSCAG
jgi:hypothetical protein